LSAVIVCWHFNLLPHWALAVLIVREVLIIVGARVAQVRHIPFSVNWIGRISLVLVLGGLFLAMAVPSDVVNAIFIAGVTGAVVSAVSYTLMAVRSARAG
jgi:hypothetical protein